MPKAKNAYTRSVEELMESIMKMESIITYYKQNKKELLETDTELLRKQLSKQRKKLNKLTEKHLEQEKVGEVSKYMKLKLLEQRTKVQEIDDKIGEVKAAVEGLAKSENNFREQVWHLQFMLDNKKLFTSTKAFIRKYN